MHYNVAVVGATGIVGREIINILAEREFPVKEISALASEKSAGNEVEFGKDRQITVQDLTNFDFSTTDFVLSSVSSKVTNEFANKAVSAGATLIDNSPCFRMLPEVPLIVPEVNGEILSLNRDHPIIASPNCVAVPLVVALAPLHRYADIKRVVISTYQSTSGAGHNSMDELFKQTQSIYLNEPSAPENFTKQIAFNIIPHIGDFEDDGSTGEESKIVNETKKIVGDEIEMVATCVRVSTFIGHAISATIEFESPIDEARAAEVLSAAPGVKVVDHRADGGYITPDECAGENDVFVSRIRQDHTVPHGLSLWIVSDNIRKGAALNTVQIAEQIVSP